MTVKELIERLHRYPEDMIVGQSFPGDRDGPEHISVVAGITVQDSPHRDWNTNKREIKQHLWFKMKVWDL